MSSPLAERIVRSQQLLRQHYGYTEFRAPQRRVIQSVLAGRDTLAVLPTGGGKSLCFQIPALVLGGITVVVSPLISLMQDQVAALRARGIAAAHLSSTLDREAQVAVLDAAAAGGLRLLYVSPERLERLTGELRARQLRVSLLAVDEAHCIAEWGHDFRPSYRGLRRLRYLLGRPQAVALTGSATPAVRDEITRTLGFGHFDLHLASFDRANLWFGVRRVADERGRLQALADLLALEDRIALVYAPTRNLTEAIARALRDRGYRSLAYHAGLGRERREEVLVRFLAGEVEVVVATSAFGMGIDRPDVRLVVHWTLPPTPESYYQEAGRAGRDGLPARCVLLYREGDAALHRAQLDVTFPSERLVERVWASREHRRNVPENILASVDRLQRELHPERGPVDWRPVRRRREAARARIAMIERYATSSRCRREALIGYFGERLNECSGCDRCGTRRRPAPLPPDARRRYDQLRRALGAAAGPWGGELLEPAVLRRLAEHPPASAAQLADCAGVGPVIAERLGRTILRAVEAPLAPAAGGEIGDDSVGSRLRAWRAARAGQAGVPDYTIVSDGILDEIARRWPSSVADLGGIPGFGPRSRAKLAEEILGLIAEAPVATPERSTGG